MPRTRWSGAVAAALVLLLPGWSSSAGPQPPHSPASQVAADAAWCWFSEPRAVQVGTTTFLGWISSTGDITVGAYDETSGRTRSSVLMTGFEVDDHDHPAVLVRPDGRLMAFWSAHNGDALYSRTSVRPHDVSAWGPLTTVPVRAPGDSVSTYANPVVLPAEGNRLYVFARSGHSDPAFTTSPDMGRTWTPSRRLVHVEDQRPYVKYADDARGTIAMAFTNGHPGETHSSLYYASYRGGWLRGADGRLVSSVAALPIEPSQADRVFAAPRGRDAWVHDVALDVNGRPRIVFATVPDGRPVDHDYWYAAWDGTRWQVNRITAAGGSIADDAREPSYSAGISLDHDDPSTVVLARPGTSSFEVERWRTHDLGRSWTSEALTVASQQDNVRPVVPRGGSGRAVWMTGHYGYFTTFRTAAATNRPVVPVPPLPSSLSGAVATSSSGLTLSAALTTTGVLAAAGKELTLQVRRRGWKTWNRVTTARTDTGGRARVSIARQGGYEYRWVWPGDHEAARSESQVLSA